MTDRLDPRVKRCLPLITERAMTRYALIDAIEILEKAGHVIVHPHDVPTIVSPVEVWAFTQDEAWDAGQEAFRRAVFGVSDD